MASIVTSRNLSVSPRVQTQRCCKKTARGLFEVVISFWIALFLSQSASWPQHGVRALVLYLFTCCRNSVSRRNSATFARRYRVIMVLAPCASWSVEHCDRFIFFWGPFLNAFWSRLLLHSFILLVGVAIDLGWRAKEVAGSNILNVRGAFAVSTNL
jgi:hypothetical protein